jgi:hypothetical protein
MLRRLIRALWVMPLAIGLLACSSTTPATEEAGRLTPDERPSATPTVRPSPTPAARATPTRSSGSEPASEPTRSWQIPEVGERDWTKGPANAKVTIVEYSDFQ